MAIIQNLEAFVQSYPAGLDSVTDLQLSQNENGRQIRFTIGGVTIPAGSVATISGTKPDGVVYSNTGTIEGSDTVIFDEDVQMTAVFGTWYAKIRITNAGNTIASARVRFIIDKDPVDAGAIPSESQLDGLVAEAEEYAGAAEDAAERAAITYGSPLTAATASAMTDINRVYVYTGSESGYTYGNWYYYNGSAWVSGGVYNSAAVETDTTLTESGVPADAKATGDKIDELKDDFTQIVQTAEDQLALSAWESGYIDSTGNVATQTACKYASVSITSGLVGKVIYVSGSSWWGVKPYVFVGTSVISAPVPDAGGTVTQYTDLQFTPTEIGTLYINKYDSGSVHHTGEAYTVEIVSVKSSMLPQPLPIKDVVSYSPVQLSMEQYKLLNGSTGAITDSDNANYYVTDYTEIIPNSKVMITTSHFWESGMYAFYDANKTFISGKKANSGGTPTTIYCDIVTVPVNAEYIVIGLLNQAYFNDCYLWQGEIENGLLSQKWSGKKWVLIGDSLTDHNKRAEKHYYDFIAGCTGINLVNLAMSGTGYAKSTTNFMAQANSVPSDADVVTILGSFNDLTSGLDLGTATDTGSSTIAGCINTTLDNIQTIIPLANIGVIAPTPWDTTPPSTSGNAYNYVEMIKSICEMRSIPFLDLWRNSNLRPWDADFRAVAYTNDDGGGVHPDSNGHALIAPRIKAFLETLLM